MKGQAKKKKPVLPMYYRNEDSDQDLMRETDMGMEDSGDPLETDGYGAEDDQGLAGEAGGTDPWALPGEGKMPAPDKAVASKLRRKGMPKRSM